MPNRVHPLSVVETCVLAVILGCSSSQTETSSTAATSPATNDSATYSPETNAPTSTTSTPAANTPDDEQGLTEAQISQIVAENRRVLGAMPDTNDDTSWNTIATIKCPANEEIDQTFTADSTWRIRWVSGGNCVVRTKPIDAYNGWYAFGGLSNSQPTTKPNKNPGKHSVNVSLCFADCTLVVEQAAK